MVFRFWLSPLNPSLTGCFSPCAFRNQVMTLPAFFMLVSAMSMLLGARSLMACFRYFLPVDGHVLGGRQI